MIYITLNYKGGSGKSSFAGHLLPEYIRRKGQESVSLFEFDSYSKSSKEHLSKSRFIESSIISEKDIEKEVYDLIFESASGKDVILDVGAGMLVNQIIKVAEENMRVEDLVFVIPYANDAVEPLYDTVVSIEKNIKAPKILIVMNRMPQYSFDLETAKSDAISLFGSKEYLIAPSPYLETVEKYIKAALPYEKEVFAFAMADKCSLTDLRKEYGSLRNLSIQELEEYWRESGVIGEEPMTKEQYKENSIIMQRQMKASRFLDNCSLFFDELKKLEEAK